MRDEDAVQRDFEQKNAGLADARHERANEPHALIPSTFFFWTRHGVEV